MIVHEIRIDKVRIILYYAFTETDTFGEEKRKRERREITGLSYNVIIFYALIKSSH